MKREKKVSLKFDQPFTVKVSFEGELSDKEILALAKLECINQLKERFPVISYSIADGKALDINEVKPGLIVKLQNEKEVGIVTAVKQTNKYPVSVLLSGDRKFKVLPIALEKVSKRTKVESVVWGRPSYYRDRNEWFEGTTAYFVNSNEIIPVVFGKVTKTQYHIHPIGHEVKGSFYRLSSKDLVRVFDDKVEAQAYIKFLKNGQSL